MGRNTMTILMADDDAEDLEMIEEHLRIAQPGLQLEKFMDGKSALDHLLSRPNEELPSAIILDYNMPGLTGSQILSRLRDFERFESIPKVVLSSSNTDLYIRECLANGASEYIVKPSNMTDLGRLAQKLVSMAIDPQGGRSRK